MTRRRRNASIFFIFTNLFLAGAIGAGAQNQTGSIVFFRDYHYLTSDIRPSIFCDGKELARMQTARYFQVTAPPGTHKCTAESLKHETIDVIVSSGDTSYVKVTMESGFPKNYGVLYRQTQSEYEAHKSKLKPLEQKWIRTDYLDAAKP